MKVKAEIKGMQQKLGELKSQVMEQVIQLDKKQKIDDTEKEKIHKELLIKQKLFAKQVKDMNLPKKEDGKLNSPKVLDPLPNRFT